MGVMTQRPDERLSGGCRKVLSPFFPPQRCSSRAPLASILDRHRDPCWGYKQYRNLAKYTPGLRSVDRFAAIVQIYLLCNQSLFGRSLSHVATTLPGYSGHWREMSYTRLSQGKAELPCAECASSGDLLRGK